MTALISVLIPCKDAQPFLQECLDSISDQTFPDFEVIVVDDHSHDDSRAILEGHAAADSRFQIYTNDGHGIISALRLAFKKSSGQYITRMDADDLMDKDKLRCLYDRLANAGRGHLAVGGVDYFRAGGVGDGYLKYTAWLNQLTQSASNWQELYRECVIPSPCWMLHRDDLMLCGAFDSDIYPEDYDLCFRMYAAGLQVIPCDTIVHHWRDHDGRSSRTLPAYADNRFLDLKIAYFLKLHYDETRTLRLWGAGKKGKYVAKYLIEKQVDFIWQSDNPKKIGHAIYGQIIVPEDVNPHDQYLVLIADPDAQIQIRNRCAQVGLTPMKDVFWFC